MKIQLRGTVPRLLFYEMDGEDSLTGSHHHYSNISSREEKKQLKNNCDLGSLKKEWFLEDTDKDMRSELRPWFVCKMVCKYDYTVCLEAIHL